MCLVESKPTPVLTSSPLHTNVASTQILHKNYNATFLILHKYHTNMHIESSDMIYVFVPQEYYTNALRIFYTNNDIRRWSLFLKRCYQNTIHICTSQILYINTARIMTFGQDKPSPAHTTSALLHINDLNIQHNLNANQLIYKCNDDNTHHQG